jgi:Domain of unknown function (DUF4440)
MRAFGFAITVVISALLFNAATTTRFVGSELQNNRAADAAAIRAHIESIFQAFIDGDEDKIFATHSEDWRGFLEGSRGPIKGIDEYMRANGIEWPRTVKPPKWTPYYPAGTGYKLADFDVQFYGPELAVASFNGEFVRNMGNTTVTMRRFRIMDVYAKRKGKWIQVASHTVIDPEWRSQEMSKLRTVTPEFRQQILTAREAVWRAWFTNDLPALEKLIPEEAIAIDSGSETWSDRKAIFANAQRFAESGGKLIRLEFPKTELQVYGNTIIVYTTYIAETEVDGKRNVESGRGTEMFVQRGETLVNVGWHLDSGNKN